jgi:hypothetical protein
VHYSLGNAILNYLSETIILDMWGASNKSFEISRSLTN